jgi:hypothetical protein
MHRERGRFTDAWLFVINIPTFFEARKSNVVWRENATKERKSLLHEIYEDIPNCSELLGLFRDALLSHTFFIRRAAVS